MKLDATDRAVLGFRAGFAPPTQTSKLYLRSKDQSGNAQKKARSITILPFCHGTYGPMTKRFAATMQSSNPCISLRQMKAPHSEVPKCGELKKAGAERSRTEFILKRKHNVCLRLKFKTKRCLCAAEYRRRCFLPGFPYTTQQGQRSLTLWHKVVVPICAHHPKVHLGNSGYEESEARTLLTRNPLSGPQHHVLQL